MIGVYYYSSASGTVRLFAERLGRPVYALSSREVRGSVPDAPWVLVTPSYKTGNPENDTIPEPVRRFLSNPQTRRLMVGVMGSGNRNFGEHYQAACRQIAAASGRPVLFEFELQGTQWDVARAREILTELDDAFDVQHAEPAADTERQTTARQPRASRRGAHDAPAPPLPILPTSSPEATTTRAPV